MIIAYNISLALLTVAVPLLSHSDPQVPSKDRSGSVGCRKKQSTPVALPAVQALALSYRAQPEAGRCKP